MDLIVTSDHVFTVAREYDGANVNRAVVVAYDPIKGDERWVSRVGNATTGAGAHAASAAPDGARLFVAGYGGLTYALESASGDLLWSRWADPAEWYDLAAGADGTRVFVTGAAYAGSGDEDVRTVAMDAETGALLWTRAWDNPNRTPYEFDRGYEIAPSPDGTLVAIAAYSGGTSDTDAQLLVYDVLSGELVRSYRETVMSFPNAIAWSPDSSHIAIAGYALQPFDGILSVYDVVGGTPRWSARVNGPANGIDTLDGVAFSPDGSKVHAGGSGYNSTRDLIFTTFDTSSGTRLALSLYDNPRHTEDAAGGFALSPNGRWAYLGGYMRTSTSGLDCLLVRFDTSTGQPDAAARFNGAANKGDCSSNTWVGVHGPTQRVVLASHTSENASIDLLTLAYRKDLGPARPDLAVSLLEIWANAPIVPDAPLGYVVRTRVCNVGEVASAPATLQINATARIDVLSLSSHKAIANATLSQIAPAGCAEREDAWDPAIAFGKFEVEAVVLPGGPDADPFNNREARWRTVWTDAAGGLVIGAP